ncbi:MAG: hypothetical protein R2792_02470 [Saprospiraceae bacterium]
MKKLILFILLLQLGNSCQKEEPLYDELGRGKGYALVNGEPWNVKTSAVDYDPNNNSVTVSLFEYDEYWIPRKTLGFINLPLSVDSFAIPKFINFSGFFAGYSTTLADGDVNGDQYYSPDPGPDSYIIIDSYDEKTGELWARFNCVVVGTPRYDLTLPDTLRFEEGWFRVKILK